MRVVLYLAVWLPRLSREQLQSLARVANVLGREVEEVTSDVTNYVQQLQGLTPAALLAATCDAVHQWMDRAAGVDAEEVPAWLPTATVVAWLPATCSSRSELDQKLAVLAKQQAALRLAIRQGQENPVVRAIRILEAALGDVVIIIKKQAAGEEWPAARRQERLQEIQEPVETLVRTARATWRDADDTAWVTHVCSLGDEVLESGRQVIENQSTDYTLEEVDEELELLAGRGQRIRELLDTGRRDGFVGHPEFKEAQRAVLGEITAQVTGAETWLEKVRNNLYTAVAPPRGQGQWTPGGIGQTWSLSPYESSQPPSQTTSTRSAMQPSMEWFANTIADLVVSRGSRPVAGVAGLPEQVDALALLARTQALSIQSLQQVAEGLTRWTDAEMKHLSKDWLAFDGQVIHYIAWKREWSAHHQENYPGLQGGCPEAGAGGEVSAPSGQGVHLLQVNGGPGVGVHGQGLPAARRLPA